MGIKRYLNKKIAQNISKMSRYYEHLIQLEPLAHDNLEIFKQIENYDKQTYENLPDFKIQDDKSRSLIFLNANLNYNGDLIELLTILKTKLNRRSRIILLTYNPYYSFLYKIADWLKIRKAPAIKNFITCKDLQDMLKLSGYELVKISGIGFCLNLPVFKHLGLCSLITIRPIVPDKTPPSLSIIIPARNEAGNIEEALKQMPKFPTTDIEIIFVEGNSTDDTWKTIQQSIKQYHASNILSFQQTGKGKADAVRLAIEKSSKDLIAILDADLTVNPKDLVKFYKAYINGQADFINGSRLVYTMETGAMRFINHLGNIFFAKLLTLILNVPLSDTLCGTKVFTKDDYLRFTKWRKDFGDFDPFGDFELLFPMAILSIGCVNLPVKYASRKYGETNIRRVRDGVRLLKMCFKRV